MSPDPEKVAGFRSRTRCRSSFRTLKSWIAAATEAHSLGHGGVATVARATGLAESTIRLGQKALMHPRPAQDEGYVVVAPVPARHPAVPTGLPARVEPLVSVAAATIG